MYISFRLVPKGDIACDVLLDNIFDIMMYAQRIYIVHTERLGLD